MSRLIRRTPTPQPPTPTTPEDAMLLAAARTAIAVDLIDAALAGPRTWAAARDALLDVRQQLAPGGAR